MHIEGIVGLMEMSVLVKEIFLIGYGVTHSACFLHREYVIPLPLFTPARSTNDTIVEDIYTPTSGEAKIIIPAGTDSESMM